MQDATELNAFVRSWAAGTKKASQAQFTRLNIVHRPNSQSLRPAEGVLTVRAYSKSGLPSKVGVKFPRHMVFVHKGVGKGVKAGDSRAGTSRRPKEWFNPVVESRVESLADGLADRAADLMVNSISIK